MAVLSERRMGELLVPYCGMEVIDNKMLTGSLAVFLELLLKWNARTNLTAVREPEAIVQRHFGESLFAARMVAGRVLAGAEVLDFGSGAGFPGIPMQMWLPEIRVTLAESQGKKAAFLREAVRTLGLQSEVWAGRVEDMAGEKRFEGVTLRAVDGMEKAVREASRRVKAGGWMGVLAGSEERGGEELGWESESWAMPLSERSRVVVYRAPR